AGAAGGGGGGEGAPPIRGPEGRAGAAGRAPAAGRRPPRRPLVVAGVLAGAPDQRRPGPVRPVGGAPPGGRVGPGTAARPAGRTGPRAGPGRGRTPRRTGATVARAPGVVAGRTLRGTRGAAAHGGRPGGGAGGVGPAARSTAAVAAARVALRERAATTGRDLTLLRPWTAWLQDHAERLPARLAEAANVVAATPTALLADELFRDPAPRAGFD